MKLLQYAFDKDYRYAKDLFSQNNIAFIDIETDGLSHKNKIVLIGLVIFSDKSQNGTTIQLFNEDYQSERIILKELFNIIEEHQIDYFISFNGDSFDFPFINARISALKLNRSLNKKFNIDLLRIVRKNKHLFPFEKYTLKSVEQFLGIDRSDTISGKDSVILYHSFIETKDPQLEKMILLHNYEDIINMVPLLNIYKNIKFDPLLIKFNIEENQFYVLSCELKKDTCKLILSHPYKSPNLDHYYQSLGSSFEQNDDCTTVTFETKKLASKESETQLTVVDTRSVFGIDFTPLSQNEKQAYLIAVDQTMYWDNIVKIIIKIYNHFIE